MSDTQWHWYQVKFDLGVQGTEQFPEDPAEFLAWLVGQQSKYVGGLKVLSAVLVTKSDA